LIVSIMAMVRSLQAQREANALQGRIARIEEDRELQRRLESLQAKLKPELRKAGSSYRLYLVNSGLAEARNIRVRMDGVPFSEHMVGGDRTPSTIGPGCEASCLLGLSLANSPPFDIEVQWDDDWEMERSYRTTLTF